MFFYRYIDAIGSPLLIKKDDVAHSLDFAVEVLTRYFYPNTSCVQDSETLIPWKILFLLSKIRTFLFILFLPKTISKSFLLTLLPYTPPYLWGLIVHRKNCNIEADPIQSASMLIADGKNKLDLLRFGSNVLQGWHVSNFHIVHSMLQKEKEGTCKRR